jgi:serine/threonine protein kinase
MSRLVREISIMEILQHENIVKLYETFESCDSLFLVMEYVPGWNLDEYLQKTKGGALDENEARHLFRQLVTAVDFCHRKWVVHRDLKVHTYKRMTLYMQCIILYLLRLQIYWFHPTGMSNWLILD